MSDAVYEAVLERVRQLAQNTFNIYWTNHMRERMAQRGIVDAQALRVLREGTPEGELELEGGDWKMTLSKQLWTTSTCGRGAKPISASSRDGKLENQRVSSG